MYIKLELSDKINSEFLFNSKIFFLFILSNLGNFVSLVIVFSSTLQHLVHQVSAMYRYSMQINFEKGQGHQIYLNLGHQGYQKPQSSLKSPCQRSELKRLYNCYLLFTFSLRVELNKVQGKRDS